MSRNSFENAKRRLNGLPGALQRACFAAMGRTLSHSKTVLSREIRSEYSIKAKTARRAISAKRVKGSGSTSAEIRVRGPNLFASEFAMRPRTDTTGAKRREVRLGIRKTGLKSVDRGFVSKGLLLQRKTSSSYPLEPVFGPSVAGMAANDEVVKTLELAVAETFERRLDHEVKRLLSKGTKSK